VLLVDVGQLGIDPGLLGSDVPKSRDGSGNRELSRPLLLATSSSKFQSLLVDNVLLLLELGLVPVSLGSRVVSEGSN